LLFLVATFVAISAIIPGAVISSARTARTRAFTVAVRELR